jgi:hypothetical protein
MPDRKAEWLAEDFNRVIEMRGPEHAKELLFGLHGRDEKTKFLRGFKGIGKKYSRNLLMDIYDADFRDSIAIDQRILSISKAIGLSFKDYEEHERFYIAVAKDAGLNGWELDRLMYQFTKEFLEQLGFAENVEKVKAAVAYLSDRNVLCRPPSWLNRRNSLYLPRDRALCAAELDTMPKAKRVSRATAAE